jgi:hypothetical protein
MRQYAIQQWAEEFGFEYQGTNSKPSDLWEGGKIVTYAELLQLADYPVAKEAVEKWMDSEVFRLGSVETCYYERELSGHLIIFVLGEPMKSSLISLWACCFGFIHRL